MTDFLTSLMARSLGTEPAIRPRVASLFEPVRNGDVTLREEPAAEPVETAVASEVEASSDGARKANRATPSLREDRELSDGNYPAEEGSGAATVPQARGESGPRPTTVLAYKTRKEDRVIAAAAPPRSTPLSEERAANFEPVLRSEPEVGMPKRGPAKVQDASAIGNESDEKGYRGILLPPQASTALTAQMKNAASAMNVGQSSSKRGNAAVASPAMAGEADPVVHVTIGRIEVRATSEGKPSERPRAASPVMSLQEYLHRRAQRGGR
jgi:hypothetical protein